MIQRPASAQPKTRKGKAGKRKIRYWIFETKALCILCCSKWIPYEGDLSFQVSYESIFFVWRKTKQRENFQLYSGRREQIFRNWFHSSQVGALQKLFGGFPLAKNRTRKVFLDKKIPISLVIKVAQLGVRGPFQNKSGLMLF